MLIEVTKSQISSDCQISTFAADVTDETAVKRIADTVGTWDVLIMNAGYLPAPGPAIETDLDEYWKSYEVRITLNMRARMRLNTNFASRPMSSPSS